MRTNMWSICLALKGNFSVNIVPTVVKNKSQFASCCNQSSSIIFHDYDLFFL